MTYSVPIDKLELFTKEQLEKFPVFEEGDYAPLLDAIRDERLIVFYGAGVSRLGGCASWLELAQIIIESMPSELFSKLEKTVLSEMAAYKARDVISICHERAQSKSEYLKIYHDAIVRAVTPDPKKSDVLLEVYTLLLELKPISFITTNIDKLIENLGSKLKGRRIINVVDKNDEDFSVLDSFAQSVPDASRTVGDSPVISNNHYELCNGNIFYLHGSIARVQGAVLGINQYIEHYYRQKDASVFLGKVFAEDYTVLFIGYGLEEYEVLQNIYLAVNQKPSQPAKAREFKHFILTGIYTSEIAKFNIQRNYFNMFSVCPIPYFIDHSGHAKLLEVLKKLIPLARECRAALDKIKLIKKTT